jgi:outer membrane autotransporter protein
MNATGVSEVTKAIVNLLNELSQLYPKAYTAALTALAPETAPAVQQAASETAGAVFSAVGSRLSGGSVASSNQGMSSGDALDDVAVWAQGMFNHARLTGSKKSTGFHSDTWGTAFGIEKKLNPAVKVGVGYAYSKTDIKGFMRKTDVKTHTALVYGEYKPSNWYANAVMSYGWSDYEENKNVAGINVKSKYDVEAFGLQAMTGYDIYASAFKLTPEAGLRYVYVKQDTYTDSSGQRIKSRNSDTLTGVLGAKVSKSYTTGNGIVLTPELKAAMTYDISHDNSRSTVTLVNGSVYNVSGKPLNRFGVELGAGLTAEINDKIELSAGYEGKFRKDYQDHTGLVSAKYNF